MQPLEPMGPTRGAIVLRSGLVGGIALPILPPLRRVMQINFRAAGLVFPSPLVGESLP